MVVDFSVEPMGLRVEVGLAGLAGFGVTDGLRGLRGLRLGGGATGLRGLWVVSDGLFGLPGLADVTVPAVSVATKSSLVVVSRGLGLCVGLGFIGLVVSPLLAASLDLDGSSGRVSVVDVGLLGSDRISFSSPKYTPSGLGARSEGALSSSAILVLSRSLEIDAVGKPS